MKKLEEMSIEELKSTAYDEIGKIENSQRNLKLLNARIAELSQKENKKTEE